LAAKDLRSKLLEHHPDWKIPERRVKKFLKRHLSQHGDPSEADDDATVVSVSGLIGPGKRLRNLFKVNKRDSTKAVANDTPESAPVIPLIADDESPASPEKKEQAEEEPTIEEEEPEPAPLEQTRNLEQAYSDDNDGLKKNDCHCHCSEACAIM
jgi:hypothetical protein